MPIELLLCLGQVPSDKAGWFTGWEEGTFQQKMDEEGQILYLYTCQSDLYQLGKIMAQWEGAQPLSAAGADLKEKLMGPRAICAADLLRHDFLSVR